MASISTALILALGAIMTFDSILTKESIIKEVNTMSSVLAARSEVAVNFNDSRNSQSNLDALKNSPEYVMGCIYGRDNVILARFSQNVITDTCPSSPPNTLADIETITSYYIHQWTPVLRNGHEVIGHLYLRRSLSALSERLTQFTLTSMSITFFVLIMSYLVVAWLQRFISKPILDLSSISTKIATESNYKLRTPVESHDEIGTLGTAFNSMLATIETAQKDLRFMAYNDALTGLPNRRQFMETLERNIISVQKNHRTITLFLIDLDGFKTINDTIGHDAGDMVLQTVSKRMPKVLRRTDLVARLGGDEFTVILSDLATPETISKLALNLIASIEEPIHFKGQRADVSASIGIALAPKDATTMDNLLKFADAAMYRAKAGGKKTFYFYDAAVDLKMKRFYQQEENIEQNLLETPILCYRPVVDLAQSTVQSIIVSIDNLVPTASTTFNVASIRHFINPGIADIYLDTLLTQLGASLADLAKAMPDSAQLEIIIPVSEQHLSDETHVHRLSQFATQMNINGFQIFYATNRHGFENLASKALINHIILSDDGTGVENFGGIDNLDLKQCLASLPAEPLSEWETLAWSNLVTNAKAVNTQLIALNVNTKMHLKSCRSLGIQYCAGDIVFNTLTYSELTYWLSKANGLSAKQL